MNKNAQKQKFTIIIRTRPNLDEEHQSKGKESDNILKCTSTSINIRRKYNEEKIFKFNHVLQNSSQAQIYKKSSHLVEAIFEGHNSTFLAYGQTGTGKTYTVFGQNLNKNTSPGFLSRAVDNIFTTIKNRMHGRQFAVKVNFAEFYLDSIYDLIADSSKKLQLKQTTNDGLQIRDITEIAVKSAEQLFECLRQAIKIRRTEQTSINKRSSRSHAIVQITLLQRWNQNGETMYLKGILKVVDLAGSERVSKTQSFGNRLEEAKRINQQITTLGKCINMLALAEKQGKNYSQDLNSKFNFNKNHIPYRDAKITRYLSESLSGKSKIILCICISKLMTHSQETFSSLMFGAQASALKIDSKRNQIYKMNKSADKIGNETSLRNKIQLPRGLYAQRGINKEGQSFDGSDYQKNRLREKFQTQAKEINQYLQNRTISPENQSKECLKENLINMLKIYNAYRQKMQNNSYDFP